MSLYQSILPISMFSYFQPENLLLASKKHGAGVKLADFGLAVEAMDGKHYYGEHKGGLQERGDRI